MLTCTFMLIRGRYNLSFWLPTDSQTHPQHNVQRRPKASLQDNLFIQAKPYSGSPQLFFYSAGQSQCNVFTTWFLLTHSIASRCTQNSDTGHQWLLTSRHFILEASLWCQPILLKAAADVSSMSQPRHITWPVAWLLIKLTQSSYKALLNTSDLLLSTHNYLRLTLHRTSSTD
jgi:hypothetical protein